MGRGNIEKGRSQKNKAKKIANIPSRAGSQTEPTFNQVVHPLVPLLHLTMHCWAGETPGSTDSCSPSQMNWMKTAECKCLEWRSVPSYQHLTMLLFSENIALDLIPPVALGFFYPHLVMQSFPCSMSDSPPDGGRAEGVSCAATSLTLKRWECTNAAQPHSIMWDVIAGRAEGTVAAARHGRHKLY